METPEREEVQLGSQDETPDIVYWPRTKVQLGPEEETPDIVDRPLKKMRLQPEDVESPDIIERSPVLHAWSKNHEGDKEEEVLPRKYERVRRSLFSNTSTSSSHQKKSISYEPKTTQFEENSFEVIPSKSPPYPYRRDAVRKKNERRQLPRQECDMCRKFYESQREVLGDTQTALLIEKCSRHRYKYKAPITPPGF